MLKDFKAFILRGNVVDLAIGIVIGSAFTAMVTAFVANLLTPLISIPGKTNFSDLVASVGGAKFHYGIFINAVISFLLVATVIFFLVVRPLNMLMARRRAGQEPEPGTRECPECCSEISAAARRCPYCTSDVSPAAATT
jgi:large conductance mechanosensitive channel